MTRYRIPAYWSGSTRCSGPHCTGATSGPDGCFVSVFRAHGSRYRRGDIDGLKVADWAEADAAMAERGYGTPYYRRSSVPLPLFRNLESEVRVARFDALYRYVRRHRRKGTHPEPGLYAKAKRLAKQVGIFHAAGRGFLEREAALAVRLSAGTLAHGAEPGDIVEIARRPDGDCRRCNGTGRVRAGLGSKRWKPCRCVALPAGGKGQP